jgi:hypothetical protein
MLEPLDYPLHNFVPCVASCTRQKANIFFKYSGYLYNILFWQIIANIISQYPEHDNPEGKIAMNLKKLNN